MCKSYGFNTYNVLLPGTGSAVVVLTNSQSLNGGVRWIGELLVEALLNNSHNAPDYSILAKESAGITLQQVNDINKSLAAGRTNETPSRPLEVYVGKYFNGAGIFIEQGIAETRPVFGWRIWAERPIHSRFLHTKKTVSFGP